MRSRPGLSFIALANRQHERHVLTVTRRADSTLNRPALRPGSPPIEQELPVTAMVPMQGSPAADGPWEWLDFLVADFTETARFSIATRRLENQAAGFASRVETALRRYRPRRVARLAELSVDIGDCQYHLSRLDYMWRMTDNYAKRGKSSVRLSVGQDSRKPLLILRHPPPNWHTDGLGRYAKDAVLRNAAADIKATLNGASADVSLSRERISDLLEVASAKALLAWTVVIGIVSGAAILTAVLIAVLTAQ